MDIFIKIILTPIMVPILFIAGFILGGDSKGTKKFSFPSAISCAFQAVFQWFSA